MDPDARLRLLQFLSRRVNDGDAVGDDLIDAGRKLAEHFSDLDDWLRHGGFLPSQWDPSQQ